MVNKIDGNNYYDYQKLKNVNIPDTGEKFSLDYKQNGLQSEAGDDKDKTDKSSVGENPSDDKSGVRLEISNQGKTAASAKAKPSDKAKTLTAADARSLIDTVRTFISTAIEAIKDFFYKIWNDPQPEDMQAPEDGADFAKSLELPQADGLQGTEKRPDTRDSSITENMGIPDSAGMDAQTAYRMDTERRDREIQKYLHSGDLNQVISLLTDDGKKTIARNSSLLTYYDRNGRMIEPNASDRERILHGDINTKKL